MGKQAEKPKKKSRPTGSVGRESVRCWPDGGRSGVENYTTDGGVVGECGGERAP